MLPGINYKHKNTGCLLINPTQNPPTKKREKLRGIFKVMLFKELLSIEVAAVMKYQYRYSSEELISNEN